VRAKPKQPFLFDAAIKFANFSRLVAKGLRRRGAGLSGQFDQRVLLDCYYARVLWLQGSGDRARRLTESLLDYVRTKEGAAGRDEPRSALARPAAGEPGPQALAPVYRRFTEGFGTADLIAAETLLASLR
jgi:hypothetical protein